MTTVLDGFGKPCPMPLVMVKKEIDAGNRTIAIQVDNETAVKNLARLGTKTGLSVACDAIEGGWLMTFSEGDSSQAAELDLTTVLSANTTHAVQAGSGYAVFVGKDHVGEGDAELGYNLMKMALYTLSESDTIPVSLLFMNSGVKLVTGDEQQIIDSVKKLEDRGTEVLTCGACLDFYNVKDQLKVGEVSNMYDILGRMQEASKVLSL